MFKKTGFQVGKEEEEEEKGWQAKQIRCLVLVGEISNHNEQ